MFCKVCGKETTGEFVYCPFCGGNQNEDSNSLQQTQASNNISNQIVNNVQGAESTKSNALDNNAVAQNNAMSENRQVNSNINSPETLINRVREFNVIYTPRIHRIEYGIACLIMILILLFVRMDFISSILLLMVVIVLAYFAVKLIGLWIPMGAEKKRAIDEMMLMRIPILQQLGRDEVNELQRGLGSRFAVNNEQGIVCIYSKRCKYEILLLRKAVNAVRMLSCLMKCWLFVGKEVVSMLTTAQKVYRPEEIMHKLGLGKTKTYSFLKQVYDQQYPFRVLKIGRLFRIPCQDFDSWLDGTKDNGKD